MKGLYSGALKGRETSSHSAFCIDRTAKTEDESQDEGRGTGLNTVLRRLPDSRYGSYTPPRVTTAGIMITNEFSRVVVPESVLLWSRLFLS